jgi:cell division septation protein DedD
MLEERRQYPRLVPSAPLFVSLDDSKSGLLLDLCEGGLAVASLVPRTLDEFVSLTFDLPEGTGQVQARAKIAWTRDSGHLTGVRFVDFDGVSQQQLGEWIASRTNLRAASSAEVPEPVFVTRSTYSQVDPIPQEMRDAGGADARMALFTEASIEEPVAAAELVSAISPTEEGGRKSRYTIEWVLAIVVLSWALVFLGYQMGSSGITRHSGEIAAIPKVAEASTKPEVTSTTEANITRGASLLESSGVANAKSSAATLATVGAKPGASIESSGTGADSGIVVQVGAMKIEDNAAALAKDLRKRKYPAFVFQHGRDKLYRVAVGPYDDAEAGIKVKSELQKQGFQALLGHWTRD